MKKTLTVVLISGMFALGSSSAFAVNTSQVTSYILGYNNAFHQARGENDDAIPSNVNWVRYRLGFIDGSVEAKNEPVLSVVLNSAVKETFSAFAAVESSIQALWATARRGTPWSSDRIVPAPMPANGVGSAQSQPSSGAAL